MPELPEALVWERLLKKEKKFKKLLFYLLVSPLAFSLGSAKRKYITLTATQGNYTATAKADLPTWVSDQRKSYGANAWPPASWKNRAVKKGVPEKWQYLLEDTLPGQLICVRRGKVLVVACGHHAMVISFGLEAHLRTMTPEIFWRIIRKDVPGSNPDPEKAKQMRNFRIPDEFTVKGSSSETPRTIRILAAFISTKHVIVLCDFCGLARMHVESRNVHWTEKDFEVGSQAWDHMFRKFKGGPDWIVERKLAETALINWRANVREEHAQYEVALEAYRREVRSTRTLDEYLSVKGNKPPVPISPPAPPPLRPIIREMCVNSGGAFTGIGRHLGNDVCFNLAIHPATPAIYICEDDTRFAEVLEGIPGYLNRFIKRQYWGPMSASCGLSQDNPFKFNEDSNRHYMQSYIDVFRRCSIQVPKELYIRYLSRGLLDSGHVIGQPYAPKTQKKLFGSKASDSLKAPVDIDTRTRVNVFFVGRPLKAFTIIRARIPDEWKPSKSTSMSFTPVKIDIAKPSHATTIGPDQFHELVLNRVLHPVVDPKGGRPGKVRNGRNGRPPKEKRTKKTLKNSAPQERPRVYAQNDPDGDPSDSDDNPGDADEDGDVEAAMETPWMWTLPKGIAKDVTRDMGAGQDIGKYLEQHLDRDVDILDYVPFIIESPEFQALVDRKSAQLAITQSFLVPPEVSRVRIVRKANGPLQIERIFQSHGLQVLVKTQPQFYSKDDVIQEARRVVVEESPYSDFNRFTTALKWSKGVLDYHSAKAILNKGDAVTDEYVEHFLIKNSDVDVGSGTASKSSSKKHAGAQGSCSSEEEEEGIGERPLKRLKRWHAEDANKSSHLHDPHTDGVS